ncbi:MAG: imidazoleglycerol-phosphate dehydratase HisB [Planctomycetota bacterium]|jgi:imidazoleglycerol-phosphate dehydratase
MTTPRTATLSRKTTETDTSLTLSLDGTGNSSVRTGIEFLDHMLTALSRHSSFDLELSCEGDLEIDDHHTAEDCAILLGQAIDRSLADRRAITRFAHSYAPLDEALSRCVVDLSGRPHCCVNLSFTRDQIGTLATENITHFFISLATSARCSLHIDLIRGENSHHIAESAFKALALALKCACAIDPNVDIVPSTKGTLS